MLFCVLRKYEEEENALQAFEIKKMRVKARSIAGWIELVFSRLSAQR